MRNLAERIERHRRFYRSSQPGDMLVYLAGNRHPSLEAFLCTQFDQYGPEVLLSEPIAGRIESYVSSLRESLGAFYSIDDDSLPSAHVYWGIGGITASMVGQNPVHDPVTSWLEPNLSWSEIERLEFDGDERWLRFARDVNQALWNCWEEDYLILPYLHRSPLDAANGIRGTELFVDMYEHPERVKALADWCAEWSISVEKLLTSEAPAFGAGFGTGIWGAWLPDGGVFVNGDPVGLINREMAERFDRPSIEKLFTNTGGGFFHNHTVGLYQADLVSSYRGTLMQFFVNDPNQPSFEEALLYRSDLREKLITGSLQCPIGGWIGVRCLDEILEVTSRGRFVLAINVPDDADIDAIIQKIRTR